MAKIIKVGSQNPTFTSQKAKKVSPMHTHRNSNEATNPFKFTNFEGKTLPFECADVFTSFKPQSSNRLRIIASSVTGSMNKMKSSFTESIVNFANRMKERVSGAINYISEVPVVKQMNEILFTPIQMPKIEGINMDIIKDHWAAGREILNRDIVDIGKEVAATWSNKMPNLVPSLAFHGRQKYSNMTVAELETHFAAALAEGGNNE